MWARYEHLRKLLAGDPQESSYPTTLELTLQTLAMFPNINGLGLHPNDVVVRLNKEVQSILESGKVSGHPMILPAGRFPWQSLIRALHYICRCRGWRAATC